MEKGKKYRVECRHYSGVLTLPCNCVSAGFCGVDGRRCDVVILAREEFDEPSGEGSPT